MHGTEHRISDCRAYSPQAPRSLAYPASASSPLDAPQLIFPKRDRSLVAAFPSPRTPSACADTALRSMVLTCYFAHSLAVRPARSAFWLPRQALVGPSFRRHPRLKPVAFCTGPLCQLCRQVPLPFRSFRSLRIKALLGFATVRSAFRNCPIFVRSPQPFHLSFWLRIIVSDPLHLPEAYCPSNLLEPSSL
jgi:hypothetical protein